MKIVHIIWSFTFGGIETMLVNIANEQVKMGHNVNIVIIEEGKANETLLDALDCQINIHYAHRKWGKKDLVAILRLNRIIIKLNPDTIHLHSATIFKYLLPVFRKVSNNTLHDMCGISNTENIDKIPRVFAISNAVATDLKVKKNVTAIPNPNGIRPELIQPKDNLKRSNVLRIIQVSRLMHEKKGQDILIRAGSEIQRRGYNNFTIEFIGDGDSLIYLKQLANDEGIADKVTFCGAKSQQYIFEHLCDYDLFVQPSRYEGFGLTVAEAMAAKLPVIVSSGQGPEEIIDGGKYGYVFKDGDFLDCANKIELFLTGKNNTTHIVEGYQRVWDLYNVKVTAKTYIAKYKRK